MRATMTTQEYLAALEKLGLGRASKKTAAFLGCTTRQIKYYAAGRPIPDRVSMLLRLYLKHGLTEECA